MAYQTPKTIAEVINGIKNTDYVLPAIQREYVWKEDQIELLFDSIMRGYPISTFLFWKIDEEKLSEFDFYEFLKKYDSRDYHNKKAHLPKNKDIHAVLDGQQRMTSLYLALCGSFTKRQKGARKDNPQSYKKKELYLNLIKSADGVEKLYDFKFLSKKELVNDENNFWFRCKDILDFSDKEEDNENFIELQNLDDTEKYGSQKVRKVRKTLNKFWDAVHRIGTISYYLEESKELEKVLQIFIRVNSGGTVLSYSDLLLSIATAQWKNESARDIIHEFVDEINNFGNGFAFNKDFVLKSCLVLCDLDVKFHIDNFTSKNMKKIEDNWDEIAGSILAAVQLVNSFGYDGKSLTSSNAVIPIAYYIYKNNLKTKILTSKKNEKDRENINIWLSASLLQNVFSGQPDGVYPKIRNVVNNHSGDFPLKELIEEFKGTRKSLLFTDDEIDNILEYKYGTRLAFIALNLLYPNLNRQFTFHIDHIHPKNEFYKKRMQSKGFSEEEITMYNSQKDKLPNLQLLTSAENIGKNGKPLEQWLDDNFSSETKKNNYLNSHYILIQQSCSFEDFDNFYDKRRELLKEKFRNSLKELITL